MSVAVITGSSGLIGSEAATFFHEKGLFVVGIDNDMRKQFFGNSASTMWRAEQLQRSLHHFAHFRTDVREQGSIEGLFRRFGKSISIVLHTAAQPSHDWAAREPIIDFTVNANGTLVMLEATRRFCADAIFVLTSTNKVYGDAPNSLPLVEHEKRWEVDPSHRFSEHGIDETMSVDQSKHSLFGVSKLAADVLTQEYGRYFGMKTAVFRGGCLAGPNHSGTELHGFLSYLIKCAFDRRRYVIHGYKGKQVRDNIHSWDMVNAIWHYCQQPKQAAVYNLGGSRHSNCSVLEAISYVEELTGRKLNYELSKEARIGDHVWWITDVRKFRRDYPGWSYRHNLKDILEEIVDAYTERMTGSRYDSNRIAN
jgi:CDP-paratose 2-epimerase